MPGRTFTVVAGATVLPPPAGSTDGDEMAHSLAPRRDGR